MINIELNHLKYFYYTVLEGGVTQAANRLHVQQPVVSKMLKHLEEELGKPLFWKNGRSKSLTDYGQLVFRHCQVVFEEVKRIEELGLDNKNLTGLLNIGAAEPVVNNLFIDKLKTLMSDYPKINFNIHTSTQSHLLTMLSDGHLDLACLFYAPSLQENLEIIKRESFTFRLVIKKSCLKDKDIIQSFIGSRELDDTSSDSFPTLDFMRKKYPKTRITLSCNSITLHKQLVLAGKGVAIIPEFMIEKELKKGQIVDLFPRKKFQFDLKYIKRKTSHLSIPGNSFLN